MISIITCYFLYDTHFRLRAPCTVPR